MQIIQALTTILKDRGLNISLLNNDGDYEEAPTYFFERNPVDRGLYFDDFLEHKTFFLKEAIHFNCIHPVSDIAKCLLPTL